MMVATAVNVVRFYCAIRKKCFILNKVYTVTAAEFFFRFLFKRNFIQKGIVVVIFFLYKIKSLYCSLQFKKGTLVKCLHMYFSVFFH